MKDSMPPREVRTKPMEFIPNPKFGADEFNRADLRGLAKKARNYRGKTAAVYTFKRKVRGVSVTLYPGEYLKNGQVCKMVKPS